MTQSKDVRHAAKRGGDTTKPTPERRQKSANQATTLQVDELKLSEVIIPADRREVDDAKVEALKTDIASIGLTNPISVRRELDDGNPPKLVAGRHRLEACRRLGWNTIPVIVFDDDDLAAEQREITENLIRSNLTKPQEAEATDRLKAIYEMRHPETKRGATGKGRSKVVQAAQPNGKPPVERFTKATAAATGRSEDSVKRDARRGKVLGGELLDQIDGTDLTTGAEMDALCDMPEPERKEKAAEAAAEAKKPASERKPVTARETKADTAQDPQTDKLPLRARQAYHAWLKCNRKEREIVMTMIKKAKEIETAKGRTAEVVS